MSRAALIAAGRIEPFDAYLARRVTLRLDGWGARAAIGHEREWREYVATTGLPELPRWWS